MLLVILLSEVCLGELHLSGDPREMLMWPEEKEAVPKQPSHSQGTEAFKEAWVGGGWQVSLWGTLIALDCSLEAGRNAKY